MMNRIRALSLRSTSQNYSHLLPKTLKDRKNKYFKQNISYFSSIPNEPQFPKFQYMMDDLVNIWCDGAPGSMKEDQVHDILVDSMNTLKATGFIPSSGIPKQPHRLAMMTMAQEKLMCVRRLKLKSNWFQPAVHFICEDDSALAPMASILFQRVAGGQVHVSSSGLNPRSGMNSIASMALLDIGIDVHNVDRNSFSFPKPISHENIKSMHTVITIGEINKELPEDLIQLLASDSTIDHMQWHNVNKINDSSDLDTAIKMRIALQKKALDLVEDLGLVVVGTISESEYHSQKEDADTMF